jgi:hypothetical protein
MSERPRDELTEQGSHMMSEHAEGRATANMPRGVLQLTEQVSHMMS